MRNEEKLNGNGGEFAHGFGERETKKNKWRRKEEQKKNMGKTRDQAASHLPPSG